MPSVSKKQANFMSAIAHGWHPPQKNAPSLAVAKEFHAADKKVGKYMHLVDKYAGGGKVGQASHVFGNLNELLSNWESTNQKALPPSTRMSALDVVRAILGDKVTTEMADLEAPKNTPYMVNRTWGQGPMFVGFNDPTQGTIGLRDLHSTDPRHLAEAAHEAFHAGLHEFGHVQPHDEDLVNTVAHQWLVDHLPKDDVQAAVDHLKQSWESYGKDMPDFAEGGSVDQPIDPSRTNRLLALVSHAADRATSTVTDDPHHALSRVAAGLASQVVGQSPSGAGVQFGTKPNLINEIQSLPAGLADIGTVAANLAGGLSDRYFKGATADTLPGQLSKFRTALNNLIVKHGGDIAPTWSRDAEERSNKVHEGVNRAMGLTAPKGFTENLADAGGNMLGQIPLPLGEAKTAARGIKSVLGAAARAVPEYLGPTIRPSLKNYLTGALGGGAMGALGSPGDDESTPYVADTSTMKEKFE